MSLITLTTDFGASSPYVAAMKGVILGINPAATIVDLTHDIAPQAVMQAAIVLHDFAPGFPPDTIHVAVVDPGVGTQRRILHARVAGQRFVLPDNGLLTLLLNTGPVSELISIDNPRYWRAEVSATFHGRDIMAPVAAHLSLGISPGQLGMPLVIDQIERLECPKVAVEPRRIAGQIVWIDSFGNLQTDITAEHLARSGCPNTEAAIECHGRRIPGIVATYAAHRPGQVIALVGSSGRLEIAVVQGHAARQLQASLADEVVVRW